MCTSVSRRCDLLRKMHTSLMADSPSFATFTCLIENHAKTGSRGRQESGDRRTVDGIQEMGEICTGRSSVVALFQKCAFIRRGGHRGPPVETCRVFFTASSGCGILLFP
jgi:hypothetical protein